MPSRLPKVSTKGFELFGQEGQALLLHGYTGSPYDLRPLGSALRRIGYHAICPLLCGHGRDEEALKVCGHDDWIDDSITAAKRFDQKKPLVLIGLSMGSLIAIMIARRLKNVSGMVLLSPAFSFSFLSEAVIKLSGLGLLSRHGSIKKLSGGSDILDPEAKKRCPSLKSMPINGLLELEELRIASIQNLEQIGCPVFLGFAKYDSAIDISGSKKIALDKIRAPIFCKTYDHSKHVLTLDFDRDELFEDIISFIKKNVEQKK